MLLWSLKGIHKIVANSSCLIFVTQVEASELVFFVRINSIDFVIFFCISVARIYANGVWMEFANFEFNFLGKKNKSVIQFQ